MTNSKRKILAKYKEKFIDGAGNKAILTKQDFTEKGKVTKGHITLVQWIDEPKQINNKAKREAFLNDFFKRDSRHYELWYDGPLMYVFEHNKLFHVAYWFGGTSRDGYRNHSFAVFQLRDDTILLNEDGQYSQDHDFMLDDFEATIELLTSHSADFFFVKDKRYIEYEVYCGNSAINIINTYMDLNAPKAAKIPYNRAFPLEIES